VPVLNATSGREPVRPQQGISRPKRPDAGRNPSPVDLAATVRLSKGEVFAACQALADADRRLVGVGCVAEAGALGDLFELLEDRLTGAQAGSASYSMDSEFTQ
jgi:hypothetical protein